MNLPKYALDHRAVVLAFVGVLLAAGLLNFATMSRREDPEIIIRDALVITFWPGASATRVEELVTDPLEDAIGEIAEVDSIESKSMVGISIIKVTADDHVTDTDQVWDEVRAKVMPVQQTLPRGTAPPFVYSDFSDVYPVCFALRQTPAAGQDTIERSYTPRELELFAERIEDEIELLDSVARVDFWGVQPERIYVEVDSADWAKLGITASQLQSLFESRNIVDPGGELDTDHGRYAVNPTGEFTSVEQMNELVVARFAGKSPIRIGDMPIRIERRYEEPPRSLTRYTSPDSVHQPALIIGVSMKGGRNVVEMGEEIDTAIRRLQQTELPPDLALTHVNDLPRQVNTRILDFRDNLLQGVLIVLGVGLLMMGWRPALIMATSLPLSMIMAFAIVPYFGIELEQFSIASLIIALGMVVDNAIVITDNAYRYLREGLPKREAIIKGTQEVAIPMLTSTLTTVAAFVPMLTIVGNVGEYVSSLPVVVAVTLVCSYVVAMFVTPIMCAWLLIKPDEIGHGNRALAWIARLAPRRYRRNKAPAAPATSPMYDRVIGWALNHQLVVLGTVSAMFLASLTIAPIIGSQFFPGGTRDQFFVKIWLPEGSPISATSRVAKEVERILVEASPSDRGGQTIERLSNAATFVGMGGPRLMLTMEPEYPHPYFALLVVNAIDAASAQAYAQDIRERVVEIPDARVTVEEFMLGPPIKDPVEFRLSGPDRDVLRSKAEEMLTIFKQTEGVLHPRSNWGSEGYYADVQIDANAANLAGVTNADVALTMKTILSGAELTTYREGDHLIPVMLRTQREHRQDLSDLSGIFVDGANGKVPLNSIAKVVPTWEPAVVARWDSVPTVTVGSRVVAGELANSVAGRIKPRLAELMASLPLGYRLEQGGEYEETMKAQVQVVRAVLIAVLLIALILIVQFNSFMKAFVILFTVPLALIGVLVGLWTTGWAIGFMANLGIISLIGIVINNAIILIDFIESRVADGQELRSAVAEAGRLRLQPIVLTSLTTIGGLLPLSLFGGPLWAPMTNGMIFGLIFSTALTLIVVPTLYVLFAERFGMKVGR
jgi:multidrug efflux pump subunit AcrB